MLINSRGISIQRTRYGDTGLIVKIYTESHGIITSLIKGAYRPKSSFPATFFQPLTLLDIQMDFRESRNFQYLREVSPFASAVNDQNRFIRSAMVMFMSELLGQTLRYAEEADSGMFAFLCRILIELDQLPPSQNLPLFFMTGLSKNLGIFPAQNHTAVNNSFNIREGAFCPEDPFAPEVIPPEIAQYLAQLCTVGFDNYHNLSIPNHCKRKLLRYTDQYYTWHLPGYKQLKSLPILTEIFS